MAGGALSPEVFIGAEGINSVVGEPLQVEAGKNLRLRLVRIACCTFAEEVDANVRWDVEPLAGITIDEESGVLSVGTEVEDGTRIEVRASSLMGLRTIQEEVTVFSRDSNPLIGTWQEVGQIGCESGDEMRVEMPIRELIFSSDGSLRVTWNPFEAYVDYAGQYRLLGDGGIRIAPRRINYLPPDFEGEGDFQIDEEGRLILEGVWLGRPAGFAAGQSSHARCGHIFASR